MVPNGGKATSAVITLGPTPKVPTIQASFKWQGSDPAPQTAIVTETSQSHWDGFAFRNGSVTGTCDDGLGQSDGTPLNGNPASPNQVNGSATETGTRYEITGGASPSVSWKPLINLTVNSGTASDGSAYASASYSCTATISPVTISLTGQNPTTNQALAGQQITATLNSGFPTGTKIHSFKWSFGGATSPNPIKNWDFTAPNATNSTQLVPFAATDLGQTDTTGKGLSSINPISFYDQAKDVVMVICTVNLTFPDGTTGTVTAQSPNIQFMLPTAVVWTVNQSFNGLVPGFFTNYPGQTFGANELWGPITITEPPALVPNGPGTGCIVQIATLGRSFSRTAQNGKPANYTKLQVVNANGTTSMVATPTGLDGGFPYPFGYTRNADGTYTAFSTGATWAANTKGYAADGPFQTFTTKDVDGGGTQWYSSTANDSFNTWVMYRPPPAYSQGTIYVPLQTLAWSWGGNASLTGGVWSVSQGPPFTPGSPSNTKTPPAWSTKIAVGLVPGP